MFDSQRLLSDKALFLVWGPPAYGPRSRALSQELGIRDISYVYSTRRRGLLSAPLKYPYQAILTLLLLFKRRPQLVFVQSPPSIAVLFVWLYSQITGARYIVDAHSDAFLRPIWRRPLFLNRFLARKALATIVTNEDFAAVLDRWGARAFILRDIPTDYASEGHCALQGDFNIAVVNTFSSDEPLEAVLSAAKAVPNVHFYITGAVNRAPRELLDAAPPNAHFTDFLSRQAYYVLLNSVQAVMCLTTRDCTMQRGACESLAIGKPIITSNWPILTKYFRHGTVHVANTPADISQGVVRVQTDYQSYLSGIKLLQASQRKEWQNKKQLLVSLVAEES